MNDDKRERIAMLAIIAREKQVHVDQLGARNVWGLNAEDAERAQIAYSIAIAEALEAKHALDMAMLP